jgi:hypothetical protein
MGNDWEWNNWWPFLSVVLRWLLLKSQRCSFLTKIGSTFSIESTLSRKHRSIFVSLLLIGVWSSCKRDISLTKLLQSCSVSYIRLTNMHSLWGTAPFDPRNPTTCTNNAVVQKSLQDFWFRWCFSRWDIEQSCASRSGQSLYYLSMIQMLGGFVCSSVLRCGHF